MSDQIVCFVSNISSIYFFSKLVNHAVVLCKNDWTDRVALENPKNAVLDIIQRLWSRSPTATGGWGIDAAIAKLLVQGFQVLSSSLSYSFIWGCQTQPTTYGTKNRCRHIHRHTQNTRRLKYIYTHSRTVFSSSYYGWCRLEMREKRRQCSSLMHIAES